MRNFIITVLLLFAAFAVHAVTHTESIHNTRIRVTTEDRSLSKALVRYVDRCSDSVDMVLECRTSPPKRNVFIVAGTCAEEKQRELEYRFDESTDMLGLTAGVMRVLVKRRSRELFGKYGTERSLDFISAALAYNFMMRMRTEGNIVDYDYQPALHQFTEGFFPEGMSLFTRPVSPDMPWLYRLYAMHCSLMIRCLRTLNGNMVRSMLEADAKADNEDGNAVIALFFEKFPRREMFQSWYEGLVVNIAHNDRSGNIKFDLDEKVRELETVSVVEAGGAVAGLRAVKIDDSSQSIEVLRGDKVVLYKRQNDFLRLRNSAPVLLRPALEMYARAMGYLAADDVRAFKKELKKARKNYRKASERQKRLEEKLDDFEKSHTLPVRRYSTELEIYRRFAEIEKDLPGIK